MKKVVGIFLIFSLLLCLCACDSPVLPPKRDAGGMSVSLSINYTFDIAVEEADMIAHVRIGDWLGETNEGIYSYFEAEVLNTYKGEKKKSITIKQKGNSVSSVSGFPLFTHGNELLLFLRKSDYKEYDDTYFSLGLNYCPFYVSKSDEGDVFLATEYHIADALPPEENLANLEDTKTYLQAYKHLKESDPIAGNMYFMYAYSKDDMERYIKESMSKQ